MRTYILPSFLICAVILGGYYNFLYEPSIVAPKVIEALNIPYKQRPKFDNTLSAQYSNSFDPLDYKNSLDRRITLSPEPESPIDIYGKAASSQEDQLNQIIADVEAGEKNLSELVILPNSLEYNSTNTEKERDNSATINNAKTKSRIMKRSKSQQQIMIQLASVRSVDQAKKECERIRAKYPKILAKYQCSTQIINTSQNVYNKVLMSGFTSASEAKKICKKLRSKKQSCLMIK